MSRPVSTRILHRLAIYAVIAALVGGAMAPSSAAEARSPEERSEAATKSDSTAPDHQGQIDLWLSTDAEPGPERSFRSWIASVYSKLLGLKAAIGLVLSQAWQFGHGKPDNTCS
jgi:hypothetical protein